MSINIVVLSGNLTRDPEIRVTANGGTILRFGIANSTRVRKEGEWTDKTGFYNVEMFGNKAAAVAKYLRKGLKPVMRERKLYYFKSDIEKFLRKNDTYQEVRAM